MYCEFKLTVGDITVTDKFFVLFQQQAPISSVGEPPIVKTESVKYDPSTYSPGAQAQPTTHVPVVQTETRKVILIVRIGEFRIS